MRIRLWCIIFVAMYCNVIVYQQVGSLYIHAQNSKNVLVRRYKPTSSGVLASTASACRPSFISSLKIS